MMQGCRWLLVSLLACLAFTGHLAAPSGDDPPVDDWLMPNPDIDYEDYVNEDEMDEKDLDNLANEIADGVFNEEEDVFARGKMGGGLKLLGKGFKKGKKKVGGAVVTAGSKSVRVTGKGLKIAGKAPRKPAKSSGKALLKGSKKGGKLGKGGKTGGKGGKTGGKGGKTGGKGGKIGGKGGKTGGKGGKTGGKGGKTGGKGGKTGGKGGKTGGKGGKTGGKGGKTGSKGGKTGGKGGKTGGKGGKTGGKGGKNTGNKGKKPNTGTKKGQKTWEIIKNKVGGDRIQAAKKLLKTIAKDLLDQGISLAIEAVTPLIVEYVMEKTQEGLCSCENTTCSCCADPPGFEKACLIMRIRPNKRIVNGAITYNGEELARINITKVEGEASCAKLSGVASFIKTCISPIGIGDFENGFRGCLDINMYPISLERTMCVDFSGTRSNGTAKWVPVSELDEIELEAEEEEEEDEEEEPEGEAEDEAEDETEDEGDNAEDETEDEGDDAEDETEDEGDEAEDEGEDETEDEDEGEYADAEGENEEEAE